MGVATVACVWVSSWNGSLRSLLLNYLSFLCPNLVWSSKPKSWPKLFDKVSRSRAAPLQEVLNEVMYVTPQTPLKGALCEAPNTNEYGIEHVYIVV